MKKYKVRQRVVVCDLQGNLYEGIIININDYREPSMRYAIDIDGFDDFVFVGEEQIKLVLEDK